MKRTVLYNNGWAPNVAQTSMTNDGFSTRIISLRQKAARVKSSEHPATTTSISTKMNVSLFRPTAISLSLSLSLCRRESCDVNNARDRNLDSFNYHEVGPSLATPHVTHTLYSQYIHMVPTSRVSKFLRYGDFHFIPRGTNARGKLCTRLLTGQTWHFILSA